MEQLDFFVWHQNGQQLVLSYTYVLTCCVSWRLASVTHTHTDKGLVSRGGHASAPGDTHRQGIGEPGRARECTRRHTQARDWWAGEGTRVHQATESKGRLNDYFYVNCDFLLSTNFKLSRQNMENVANDFESLNFIISIKGGHRNCLPFHRET